MRICPNDIKYRAIIRRTTRHGETDIIIGTHPTRETAIHALYTDSRPGTRIIAAYVSNERRNPDRHKNPNSPRNIAPYPGRKFPRRGRHAELSQDERDGILITRAASRLTTT